MTGRSRSRPLQFVAGLAAVWSTVAAACATESSEEPHGSAPTATTTDAVEEEVTSGAAPEQFPTKGTTGVPEDVELEPSGSITIEEDGAVIERMDITGSVTVAADDVTIRLSRVTGTSWYPIRQMEGNRGLLVEDTEIAGTSDQCQAGISFSHYTARRVDIHGCTDGLRMDGGSVTVEDSYIHDLRVYEESHNDVLHTGSGSNFVIRGNRLVHAAEQTSVLILRTSGGPIDDVLLEGNYLDGGNYVIFSRDGGNGPPTNVRIVGNTFGRSFVFGVVSADGEVTFEDNVWVDTVEPVAATDGPLPTSPP